MTAVLSINARGAYCSVELDDGSSMRCTRDFASRSRLARGQEIDPVLVERLRASAAIELAEEEACRLIRRQRYSRNEIAGKLRALGLAPRAISETLDQLEARGELDDYGIALQIARQKLRLAQRRDPALSWSQFGAAQARRLTMRGFPMGVASEAVRCAWSELAEGLVAQHG